MNIRGCARKGSLWSRVCALASVLAAISSTWACASSDDGRSGGAILLAASGSGGAAAGGGAGSGTGGTGFVCSPSTCATGCCSGNACLSGTEASACGALGGACRECGKGAPCGMGACIESQWAPTADLKFTLTRVTVTSSCTDAVGLPDPFVRMTVRGAQYVSTLCSDAMTCGQSQLNLVIKNMRPSDFTDGTTIVEVFDDDSPANPDVCFSAKLTMPLPLERKSTEYALQTTGSLVDFKFRLEPM